MAKKILIIDDDRSFVEATKTILEIKNYIVETACNGKQGYKLAKSFMPNVILLDVMMTSKTEGFEVSKSLMADTITKDIPVVIITGIRREMNLPFGFEADSDWLPVKTVLEKPVKPEALLRVIEENTK